MTLEIFALHKDKHACNLMTEVLEVRGDLNSYICLQGKKMAIHFSFWSKIRGTLRLQTNLSSQALRVKRKLPPAVQQFCEFVVTTGCDFFLFVDHIQNNTLFKSLIKNQKTEDCGLVYRLSALKEEYQKHKPSSGGCRTSHQVKFNC